MQVAVNTADYSVRKYYSYGLRRTSMLNLQESAAKKQPHYRYNRPGRSVTAVENLYGQTLNRYRYDSFGLPTVTQSATENTFLYTGEQYDQEIGLQFLRARYYDPQLGRFISRDPSV